MKEIATQFGVSLDNNNFNATKKLLSKDCKYIIGKETLIGPEAICASYQQNMIEGRKKLDKLEWGKSNIEAINNSEYFVHFTDYLTHQGIHHTHKCKQKLTINNSGKIILIEHINDLVEQNSLDEFYRKVGLIK